ncbi:LuxR C-terminal-related transcriptional regulator [Jidongwangia harbinensis]|uniref:LuxR C-terminal-related transcriptional regulator n=1 Tax=Jidongwangia harbinensis TaxID=2878561 RepID=UPI001CD99055|nr:LuxR C-terminal-related transcriptional regulator [Jidongwangia harbinensis]MCA2211485.1 LuxR C-terminal-related transcriptional regulator [Jidongwangia harbinensis]
MKQHGEANQPGGPPAVRAAPVLAAPKVSRPSVSRSSLHRARLTELLDAGARRPVTLVSAGPGWGKTTLVSAWAATQRRPVAWLTLDRTDNDPRVFSANIFAALRSATAGRLPADLGPGPGDGLAWLRELGGVLDRLPAPMVLVLDDVDVIDDARLVRELSILLRPPRAGLRTVLISRSEPALPLHRLRAAGELTEIRAGELAFDAAEAATLLAGQGVSLPPDEVAVLVQRTEGWAVGLQLAAAFVAGPDGGSVADFTGDVRPVDDYLSEEVLARQTPQVRTFLLYTSICEQLCGELADALTLERTGQRFLEQLEQVNQFVVRLDSRPFWFRYHHLVRDVLQHRLMLEAPEMVQLLHRRAADWYARHDLILDALGHAVAAQDWSYVGRLVVDAAPMILSRERARLVKVIEQVPAGVFARTAELAVSEAMLLFNAGDYAGLHERLGEARAKLAGRSDAEGRPAGIAIRALGAAVSRVDGDMPAILDSTTEQLAALAHVSFARLPSTLQYRAIALNNKGVALLWTGRTEAAQRYLAMGAAAAGAAGVGLVEINALGHLALLEVMFGSVREAERRAGTALDKAARGGWTNALQTVPAHHAMALVELERGRPERADQALQRGSRAHRSDPEAAQWKMTLGIAARLAMAQDRVPNARALLTEARRPRYPRARLPEVDRWLLATESEADLRSGRPDLVRQRYGPPGRPATLTLPERNLLVRAALATRDLSGAQSSLTERGSLMSETVATVEARILDALVSDAAGHGLRAGEMLGRAIALAAPEGIRRPFLELAGGRLAHLIDRQNLTAGEHPPFVADLVQRIGAAGRNGTARAASTLSERETEVLRYLPTMLTAAEIGEELGVSVNTIKAHMRAIYRKLGTARRRQAVARAREQGLL